MFWVVVVRSVFPMLCEFADLGVTILECSLARYERPMRRWMGVKMDDIERLC